MNLTNPSEIKRIMAHFGKHFAKSLGQNFLIDQEVIDKTACACGAEDDDIVFEIGPGIGVLTAALAERSGQVISVEIDDKLIPVLEYTLAEYNNVKIVNEDIMKLDLKKFAKVNFMGKKPHVAANLPYYITTPIIMKLLEYKTLFSSITIMVQKEVAERMAAAPGGKDYGVLSLAVQYHTKPSLIQFVPPECFMPSPKVLSAVIRLDILDNPSVTPRDTQFLFKIIKASFAQRRKTLANSLANSGIGVSREDVVQSLEQMGKEANIRGERLSLENFSDLSDILFEKTSKK